VDNLLRTCGKLVRSQWITLWTALPAGCGHRL
jgi:hypothetical protein